MDLIRVKQRGYKNSGIVDIPNIIEGITGFHKKLKTKDEYQDFVENNTLHNHFTSYLFHACIRFSNGNVIEVGTGQSTIFMYVASLISGFTFTTIDSNKISFDTVKKDLLRDGIDGSNSNMILGNCMDIDYSEYENLKLFFYDGDKEYNVIEYTLLNALPNLIDGGIFVMHDYNGGVPNIVNPILENLGFSKMTEINFIDDNGKSCDAETLFCVKDAKYK
tara:strand:+ start:8009 stop:8668 length:660 start_codon:yes stop_codon:yes gene_type:complete